MDPPGRITLSIAIDIGIATNIEQPIRSQGVAADLKALRADWLLDATGKGSNVNGNA